MLKIERDHGRFRDIVRGSIKRELRKYISHGEMIGKQGDDLISIPVTNTSVNPARSTGPALFVGGWALQQLWLFWVAPILGAAAAGIVYPLVAKE